ncbi:hypothetical protein H310_12305 [Aphanomyces invadans]|uniref:Uncharacterized protein n=1 Tax=Aphanomyces invadans TaxID=157072 RepID=A0A024TIV6_9STRA|nr:hypothetical protein H310_12305 [Aphanomyces invadans]ETV93978.1 hypothetical protein H310_12305 [Aphanomyces invadans]|eukprot:XP_008877538.1 hypothetical protein H310_12305 [Aphanomyces invadans]
MDDAVHPLSLRLDQQPLNIFTCLWLKNTRTKPLSLCIPDTILLDRGVLQQWYFTSKTGEVLRRKKDNTTKSKLLRYLHETAAGPIAAVHVYLVTEKRVLVVDHLSLAGVESLLNNPMASTHGMLQKFVPPKSCYNNMMQTVFAHDTCQTALRCTNPHMFVNELMPIELRAVTFESPTATTQKAIGNPTTLQTLTCWNREVVDHVAATVGMAITRQVLHFKMGADNKLYLLWPSSIVFENQEAIVPCQLVTPSRFEPWHASTLVDGAAPSTCPACGNPCRKRTGSMGATFLVTFKAILAAHRSSSQSHSDPTLVGDGIVPGAIRTAYGPLSDDKFTALMHDASFLYRTVQVCEECCRDINTKAVAQETAPPSCSVSKPRPSNQSTRWRSWKDPRQVVAVALGPKKPQSARNLCRKPVTSVVPVAPGAAIPASTSSTSRRNSLAGPSLHLVGRPDVTASDNQTQHAPPAYDKVELVAKPRPVSAAASTLFPTRPRPSAAAVPSSTPVAKQRPRSPAAAALASLRTVIRASAPAHNLSLRSVLAHHGVEPQHSTVTIHELFTLCYNASTPVSINDLKTVAMLSHPRDNVHVIDIDALDAMLLASSTAPDCSKAAIPPTLRPKSCVSKPNRFMKSHPMPPPAMNPKPPVHPTPPRSASGQFHMSARVLVPSIEPPQAPATAADPAGPSCPEEWTDEEAACLAHVLLQGT